MSQNALGAHYLDRGGEWLSPPTLASPNRSAIRMDSMRAHKNLWWKRLRTYLSLETLEARTPPSESIGPSLTLASLGGLGRGQSAPPPNYPTYT